MRDDLGGDFQLGPVKARVEIGGAGIAVQDLRRHLAVRRVLAGLADQNFVAAAGRQPVGEHGAGGAAVDNDEVEGHGGCVSGFRLCDQAPSWAARSSMSVATTSQSCSAA